MGVVMGGGSGALSAHEDIMSIGMRPCYHLRNL